MLEHLQNLKLSKQNNPFQTNVPFFLFITFADLNSFTMKTFII